MYRAVLDRLNALLRASERYTRTDMVYAAKGSFWLLLAQGAATLLSLPLSVAFAHFLTQNDYGIYKYVLSVASLLAVFSLSSIPTAVSRAAAQGKHGALAQGLRLSLVTSWPIVLLGFVGAAYYGLQGNPTLAIAMAIIAVASPFFNASVLFSSFLNGIQDFRRASVYNTWRNGICSLLSLATLFVWPDPLPLLVVYFVSYALTGFYFTWRAKKYAKNDEKDEGFLSFSLHTSFINGLATVADRIDAILLFQFLGAAELAIYAFAELAPETIARFGKVLNTVALPKYAQGASTRGMGRKMALISLVFLPIAAAYFFAAPYIFAILFPTYMEAVPYSQALIVLVLFHGTLPVAFLDATQRLKEKYVSSVSTNILRIVLSFAGVLMYGIWGAVVARIVTKVYSVSVAYLVVRGK